MNPHLDILVGLPGSGKSTWALKTLQTTRDLGLKGIIVNRDTLREMIHGSYEYRAEYENLVKLMRNEIIQYALATGYTVIVDETHIKREKREATRALTRGKNIPVRYVVFSEKENNLAYRMTDPRGQPEEVWKTVIDGMRNDFEPVSEEELRGAELIDDVSIDVPPPEPHRTCESGVDLVGDIMSAINRHSRENASDTPDFILADYLERCLKAFEHATNIRDKQRVVKEMGEWEKGERPIFEDGSDDGLDTASDVTNSEEEPES